MFTLSGSIVNAVFRVLFSELVPKGSEIEWFGLQVVLSCATVRPFCCYYALLVGSKLTGVSLGLGELCCQRSSSKCNPPTALPTRVMSDYLDRASGAGDY